MRCARESDFDHDSWRLYDYITRHFIATVSPCGGGTTDAEIKVSFGGSPGMSKVQSFKPGVGQNIALHASPAASFLVCPFSAFQF